MNLREGEKWRRFCEPFSYWFYNIYGFRIKCGMTSPKGLLPIAYSLLPNTWV